MKLDSDAILQTSQNSQVSQTFSYLAFLESKGAEYAPFDPTRARRIYDLLKPHIALPARIIHLIGTNGKGSTGRFITLGLMQKGAKVLHFTSPHIFHFRERFYKNYALETPNTPESKLESKSAQNKAQHTPAHRAKNTHATQTHAAPDSGSIASDDELERAHRFLQKFDFIQEASYFEYATFLALVLAQGSEYFVCEAGLGGEYDSTSVLESDLSVFTPISYDHQEMLGERIEDIATTKLKAMGAHNLIAPQRFPEVMQIAQNIAKNITQDAKQNHPKNRAAHLTFITPNDIESAYQNDKNMRAYAKNMAHFLQENLVVATQALAFFGIAVDFAHLARFDLPGRAQRIAPNILLDVGHNVDGARCILKIIGEKRIKLVYNAFFQKDVRNILSILKPIISELLIIPVSHPRIMPKQELVGICEELGIKHGEFSHIQDDSEYVVFGSFSVVETFLENTKCKID